MRENKEFISFMYTMWVILWLSLSIPVTLLAYLLAQAPFTPFQCLACIGLLYIIFDLGKTVVTLPPSKL